MKLLKPFAVLCVLGVGSALPAHAQLGGMVTGNDIDRIVELASAYGPAERRTPDNPGEGPWIRAEMDGLIYSISFLNCDDSGGNCTTIQFRAWWESGGAHSIDEMNRWNRERRFGDAYLDENNNATIEFDVNLAGGVTAVNFDDTLQWWQVALAEFEVDVIDPGYARAAPQTPPGGGSAPTK